MTSKHANISIFVPHIGCPNMCSFCNQKCITGKQKAPSGNDIVSAVELALSSPKFNSQNTEIAFFGGSFTAIDRTYMLELLEIASIYVKNKMVSGIRISTRPDAIDDDILNILKTYGVTSIELGAQSLNDDVLKANNRGHTADDVVNASWLIKKYGFELGLQMMTGLYKDCDEFAIDTAKKIIDLKPDTVRIYPTIVLEGTDLAVLYKNKIYTPQSLENSVDLCSKLLQMFENENIKVIRLGLHTIDSDSYIAGPWHPAFSELCYAEIFLNNAKKLLFDKGNYTLYVAPSAISKMVGQHKNNINILKKLGFDCVVKPDECLSGYEIKTERR